MAFYDKLFSNRIDEAIKAFDNKGERVLTDKQILDQAGEGIEDIYLSGQGYGKVGIQGFNSFYNRYINKVYESEVSKIFNYRTMAENAEIGDVIEDACNEAISEYDEGGFLQLEFKDEKLEKNENIVNNIYNEFVELFENRINCGEKLWDMFRSYLVDGRVFYERIIKQSNQKDGIITIKKLPAETMDFVYNPRTTKIEQYYQYLSKNVKRPATPEEAEKREDVVVFLPEQIGFLDYGLYGKTRQEIFGFLEKAKVAYNQLKLLETSVIIYRIVRAPERLVFKIDTGNMPKDKALKFVEKIKTRFIKKQSYNPTTGEMSQEPEVMSILENFYLPVSSDGRGSDITSIGGDAKGFTELDDIYYFSRKLYRALKYPLSRITAAQEKGESMFGTSSANEISRDEIKWAKFLERQQTKFCNELRDLFLLHLEFRGLKKQYNLSKDSFQINMPVPSHYKDAMEQAFKEQQFSNYNQLSNNPEFSKTFLIKRYLDWTDEDLKENKKGFKLDKKYFPAPEEGMDTEEGMGMDTGTEELPSELL